MFVPCGFLEPNAIWAARAYAALLANKQRKMTPKDPLKGDQDAKKFLP